ncbi:LOG family protein [Furfurilactobacillus curtus]|uniref:Cytokinin riboside 5'-monophosphate phosphoribohydrolase n=1 Tax=Furfurilactobacillus curtus TaxID=1746200 RepID=A0ABQ5JML2_9LACO
MAKINSLCVFCGSLPGSHPEYAIQAALLGAYLADHHIRLVYGGSSDGLMGTVANATIDAGGRVTGIMPRFLKKISTESNNLTDLVEVSTMDERKEKMLELSDAFIVLPGGFGTFEELGTMLSWSKIDIHTKPIALFNIDHFYDSLWQWFVDAAEAQFLPISDLKLMVNASSIDQIFDYFATFKHVTMMPHA